MRRFLRGEARPSPAEPESRAQPVGRAPGLPRGARRCLPASGGLLRFLIARFPSCLWQLHSRRLGSAGFHAAKGP
ncbi:hypothetical protein NDU88_002431 [Pleurodeles waltl]|uniref:Uncharacterized protein n=1 Tax=Pleurodeles waltl TaxID=8319 RepID=A0AAV7WLF4_PLEWA|nr:hypothetical protein NDU88_002431 [Pleurodeles waltl]